VDKQQSIVPIPKLDLFTPQAKTRWNSIEKKNQARILTNVWCGNCRRSVHIIVDSGKMEGMCLVLRGHCRDCNGSVAKLIESEEGRQERNEEGEVREAGANEVPKADGHPGAGGSRAKLRSSTPEWGMS